MASAARVRLQVLRDQTPTTAAKWEQSGGRVSVALREAARNEAPRHPDDEPHYVSGVGNRAKCVRKAEEQPEDHHDDCLSVEEKSGGRVELTPNPHVPKQTVHDARHASKFRATHQVLTEVR